MIATTAPTGRHRGDFAGVLRAELCKLRTVRSTAWALLVAFASNIGFAVLVATVLVPRLDAGERARVDVVQLALAGVHLSQIAFGVLGALTITAEYGTGMIRTTLAAVPRRRTVLAAKALAFTGVALPASTASAFAAYLAFQAALPAHTLAGTSLADPGVARAVAGGGLYLTALGLLGFGLGATLRSSAGAIATLFGLLFVPPLLLNLLPGTWKSTIGPYIPMQSGDQIYVAAHREAAALGPWTGFGVFCLYAAAALVTGFVLTDRRDA
ncbi:ABC transporter permease [Actinomadura verrucosospora]|uniref:ABC transporter transmembrane protein n=1 Tax=Actinomadura verrucosospora TaxID=46165 RepID=A0A7D3W0H8_ACTVE|nr:ABC transporter permease [Actinomadura verrucosospora]QKG23251.1 ABC transporter transmembrane protein [Actinomadura verrucosospora]